VIVGLISAPIGFCVSFVGVSVQVNPTGHAGVAFLLGMIGFLLPLAGLILGGVALRQIENTPNVGGRLLAMTGAAAGLVGTLWSVTAAMLMVLKAF
jgi:hypothetical protein